MYPETESISLTRIILEHVGYPPSVYIRDPDQLPGPAFVAQINEIVSELNTGRPIQYILGYTYFCDLKIRVSEKTLIPRPETEEMVYTIINHCKEPPAHILDIGTGSGCIALALKNRYSEAEIKGIDISTEALQVASENGHKNQLDVEWISGDILNEDSWKNFEVFDLIVSNPPYVTNNERSMMHPNVLKFEPCNALFVEDGNPLLFYRAIGDLGMKKLNETGSLCVEINERLGSETSHILKTTGFSRVTILKDIHEKERFIRAKK